MTQDTPGVVVAGTVTTEQFTMLGQRMTNIASISDVHPGRSFAWRTTSGTDAEGTRTVDPVDATTTRVTLVTRSRPSGALEKLLRPLIAPTLQRSLDRSLAQLREWLEKSA